MKVRLTAAVALAALVGLTGCGGGDSAEADGPISLRMTTWSANEAHLALLNGIAAEYRGTHPNVTEIAFDPIPFENYTTTLTTQIAGGNPPDLAWVLESAAPDFVASGALVPLDDTLKKTEGYAFDQLAPSATKLWTRDGKLYGYPFSTSPFGVFVNTDLVSGPGRPAPPS
jgi:multiple sugar transport system substrate-binding protein